MPNDITIDYEVNIIKGQQIKDLAYKVCNDKGLKQHELANVNDNS